MSKTNKLNDDRKKYKNIQQLDESVTFKEGQVIMTNFYMDYNTFDKLLEHSNIRWFDIVLYNYIKYASEIIGAYDESHVEYDRETKTTSRYKDRFGIIISDLQLSKIMRVKGNESTAKKEISHSLKRLETSGAIKREYIKMNSSDIKTQRLIIPLI